MEHITDAYNVKYPLEKRLLPYKNVNGDEDSIIYDWSILKRGVPTPPKSESASLKYLHKRVNDLQALQQDMNMKRELVHKEQSAIQTIEVTQS